MAKKNFMSFGDANTLVTKIAGIFKSESAKLTPISEAFPDTASSSNKLITEAALADKVDKIAGKGLSTNDYTNTAKAIVDSVNTNLANKVDKVTGKGLSTNDFTNTLKTKLDGIAASAQVNKLESVKLNGTALPIDANKAVNVAAVTSISVQGTAQTITAGVANLDVLTSTQLGFVSDTQYTAIQTLFA